MCNVHAIADHEQVGAMEADMVGLDADGPLARLLQENAGHDAMRAARGQEVLREGKRAPRFQDVVDQEDIATANVALDVAQDRDVSRGGSSLAVARKVDELDLGREPGRM